MYSPLLCLIICILSHSTNGLGSHPPYQSLELPLSKRPSTQRRDQNISSKRQKNCLIDGDTDQYLARHTAKVKGVSSCLQYLELNGHHPQTIDELPCDHDCDCYAVPFFCHSNIFSSVPPSLSDTIHIPLFV